MEIAQARQVLAKLRAVHARYARDGKPLTVRAAADALEVPQTTLHRLVGQWHRRPRRLGKATRARLDELLGEDRPTREICDRLGIGEGTVTRRRAALREARGELAPATAWRCPGCGGLIELVLCVACGIQRPATS